MYRLLCFKYMDQWRVLKGKMLWILMSSQLCGLSVTGWTIQRTLVFSRFVFYGHSSKDRIRITEAEPMLRPLAFGMENTTYELRFSTIPIAFKMAKYWSPLKSLGGRRFGLFFLLFFSFFLIIQNPCTTLNLICVNYNHSFTKIYSEFSQLLMLL